MKDLLEPFLYPHNVLLLGLLVACIAYRKKGLWLLLAFYYLAGNTFFANQVRHWYSNNISSYKVAEGSTVVLLGCGGSASSLTACAKARIDTLAAVLPAHSSVVMTSQYCQPYLDYLLSKKVELAADCFYGGDNTYQEFNSLVERGIKPDFIVTSDTHVWRVAKLVNRFGMNANVIASSSYSLRQVNCSYNCFFTVNLSNFDFYSKLIAEFASYGVYLLTAGWTQWYQGPN
jgi:uncharacterized SAM-binding protein YcdF (DUF218 family)